jgi:hypothetical protein
MRAALLSKLLHNTPIELVAAVADAPTELQASCHGAYPFGRWFVKPSPFGRPVYPVPAGTA